jgi:hypothetical protein
MTKIALAILITLPIGPMVYYLLMTLYDLQEPGP